MVWSLDAACGTLGVREVAASRPLMPLPTPDASRADRGHRLPRRRALAVPILGAAPRSRNSGRTAAAVSWLLLDEPDVYGDAKVQEQRFWMKVWSKIREEVLPFNGPAN